MDHKLKMHNLERLKRSKLEEMRVIQADISKIEQSISYHKRQYKLEYENADRARELLSGYSRDNIRGIVKFLLISFKDSPMYFNLYKDIEIDDMMDDDDFFDFVVINLGPAVLKDLKRRFVKVVIKDGEEQIEARTGAPMNENGKVRLWKKLTKKNVVAEAKRRYEEARNAKSMSGLDDENRSV